MVAPGILETCGFQSWEGRGFVILSRAVLSTAQQFLDAWLIEFQGSSPQKFADVQVLGSSTSDCAALVLFPTLAADMFVEGR